MRVSQIFNGCHTISFEGQHWTFRIRTQPDHARFYPGKRLFSMLQGPNNETDYKAIGTIDETEGIKLFFKYPNLRPIADIFWNVVTKGVPGWEHLLESRCICCNRKLTTPVSIKTGIGPICAGRYSHMDQKTRRLLKQLFKLESLVHAK